MAAKIEVVKLDDKDKNTFFIEENCLMSLRRHVVEYIQHVPCTCTHDTQCWKCIFKYDIQLLEGAESLSNHKIIKTNN
jgi:hypothetical protein